MRAYAQEVDVDTFYYTFRNIIFYHWTYPYSRFLFVCLPIYTFLFFFAAARPAVSPVLEDDELDEVPNTLLLEPSHVDTMSVASYHTALTHDKEFEHPAKVKKRRFDRVDS